MLERALPADAFYLLWAVRVTMFFASLILLPMLWRSWVKTKHWQYWILIVAVGMLFIYYLNVIFIRPEPRMPPTGWTIWFNVSLALALMGAVALMSLARVLEHKLEEGKEKRRRVTLSRREGRRYKK